jgi:ATP-binding cassette subfamily G (WHITE) protein 2 (PDR)
MATPEDDEPARQFASIQSPKSKEDHDISETDTDVESSHGDNIISSSNETQRGGYAPINAQDREQLTRLATQLSRTASRYSNPQDNTLTNIATIDLPDDDPSLNPQHKRFDLYKWLRVFVHNLDQEGMAPQRAGIIWNNLNVSGTGAALQLQATLSSTFMTPFRLGELFGSGSKQHKPILRNFAGVLKSGEMLIVLGRPGSGCSTFLKSLCGQLYGLDLEKNSTIHYNGEHSLFLGYNAFLLTLCRNLPKANDERIQGGSCLQSGGMVSPMITNRIILTLLLGRQTFPALDSRANTRVCRCC